MNRAPTPPPPPYWTPPFSNSSAMPRHRRSSSPVLSPPVLIVLIPIAAVIFLFFAVPPVLSFTSHIFRPIAVKKSWDSLNVLLVLFAILCGVLVKRNDDDSNNGDGVDGVSDAVGSDDVVQNADGIRGVDGLETDSVNPQRWFGYSENDRRSEKIYGSGERTPASSGLQRLRRSSSSYPDLRQESLWENRDEDRRFQFRFFDDVEIHKYRETMSFDRRSLERTPTATPRSEAKEIPVDKFVVRTPAPETPPPPPPPPPANRHKQRRTYRTVEQKEKKVEKRKEIDDDADDHHFAKVIRTPPPAPPPPPPPPAPAVARPEQKKLERRKINVKKEIATALASLYNQRKRKKKQKTNVASHTHSHDSPELQSRFPPPSPPPPPPPPLPPPPSSVFHNLFKKGTSKSKRIHSVPPPPPPPPPPPMSPSSSYRPSKHKSRATPPPAPPTPSPPPSSEHSCRRASYSGGKPPLPARQSAYHEASNVSSGCPSPLIPIPPPPPPPPPPFKMPDMRFLVDRGYVRIQSAQSSRCGSPELDGSDSPLTRGASETVNAMDGGDGPSRSGGTVFCPSPDVNLKADTFIARLYDGWRLEKINSLREKRNG